VFTIQLPPLRDRLEDLPILVQHYLRRFSAELGREVREIAPDAMARLTRLRLAGQYRELQSVLRQSLLRASGTVLLPRFSPIWPASHRCGRSAAVIADPVSISSASSDTGSLRRPTNLSAETHREVDRLLMTLALEFTHGNHRDAARLLGISRQTMRVKLRALGLHVRALRRVRRRRRALTPARRRAHD